MKLQIKKGSTDVSTLIFVQDSSATTGVGLDGLAYDTASLTCYYHRPGSATVPQITLAELSTPALDDAHADGGFIEVDSTNMPGVYRLDLPDAVFLTGVDSVVVFLRGASDMAPVPIEIELVAYDPQDTVRLGLTAMPNAAADAAGGLPISDAGGLDLDTVGSNVSAVLTDTAEIQGKLPAGDIADETTLGDIEDDTQDIQDRLPAALVSGRIVADAQAISTSTDAADKLEASAETMVIGTVSHDATAATTTEFYSNDITEATADHYNGRIVLFTSGALVGQATDITDYVLSAGEGHFTVTALTEAPADDVTFIIV